MGETSKRASSHYEILGVKQSATTEEIKAAHRLLARQLHPDKNGGSMMMEEHHDNCETIEEQFRQVQVAWECLRDESSRKEYDQEQAAKEHQRTNKIIGATPISLSEMEQAEDEDGKVVYVYDCRCGDQVTVWLDDLKDPEIEKASPVLECEGCSLTYSLELQSQRKPMEE